MAGIYPKPVQRAFRKARFDTRIVHPFASKHHRQPLHPDAGCVQLDDVWVELAVTQEIQPFLKTTLVKQVADHDGQAVAAAAVRQTLHRALQMRVPAAAPVAGR